MPSDRAIIEMGQAEAKRVGAWGTLQTLLINPARSTVSVEDLPKNVGWKNGRRTPYPWWKDAGPLDPPWDGFHLHTEVLELDQHCEPQTAWTLDLYVRDGVPVMMHGRAFVVRSNNNILAGAANALDQFTPHVTFIAAHKVGDATGKQHATFDEIADALIMTPSALAECLRGKGYLNLRGEPTPAALDVGITTIVDGGTQFCFDAIKSLVGAPKAGASEADEAAETADAVPADVVPGAPDAPKADTDPAEGAADIAAPDEPGEGETPTLQIDPTDEPVDVATPDEPAQPADVPAEPESEAPEEAVNATGRVTVWRGGGMQQVTAQPKHQRTTGADKVNQPATGPAPDTLSDVADMEAGGRQAVVKLESAMAALLAAEKTMGRRTADGEFVPHAGDNQVLQDRIKTAAEAMAKTYALLKNLGTLTMKVQQLEAENAALKRRIQGPSAEHAQIVPFRGAPSTEDGSATATAH